MKASACSRTNASGRLTIGVGRNLDDRASQRKNPLICWVMTSTTSGSGSRLSSLGARARPVRQRVLLDMAFNLGLGGLLGFKQTLAAIRGGEYERAASMMLQSRWATQVGERAKRLSRMMWSGEQPLSCSDRGALRDLTFCLDCAGSVGSFWYQRHNLGNLRHLAA